MGYPRSQLVSAGAAGTYHCVSRCVRRAFLCGNDPLSGRSFEHRKGWLERRLHSLAEIFSISLLAYAVMSNHVHVVLHVVPEHAAAWTDEEVAARWVRLFPVRHGGVIDSAACALKAKALCGSAERVSIRRQRLADLSWFMRCLVEPLARLANAEDGCSGRFWEGRFKCQVLLDDAAVLACMTYVDLNPVRAGVARDLPGSDYTSVKRRLANSSPQDRKPLAAVAGVRSFCVAAISEADYFRLVDWTGRQLHPDKRGVIVADAQSLPIRLRDVRWLHQVRSIESRYCRAIGSAQALLEKASAIGQRWLMVRRVERMTPWLPRISASSKMTPRPAPSARAFPAVRDTSGDCLSSEIAFDELKDDRCGCPD